MKIGIDIDEVVVEFVKGYLKVFERNFGKKFSFEEIHSYNFWEVLGISREDAYDSVDKFYATEEFDNINLVEGAKEAINELSKEHELIFITSRPSFINEKTKTFFSKYFPENNFEIIHTCGFRPQGKNKAEVCTEKGIPVIVEDHHGFAQECAEKGIKVFLLDKPWNKDMQEHEKITRVENWNEILEKLK